MRHWSDVISYKLSLRW